MPPTDVPRPARPRVVLIGPPGSGKSTVARGLAQDLGVSARDTDVDVEQEAAKPIREIFVDDGESAFRDLERAAVARALVEHGGVLALGGGAILDPLTEVALARYVADGGVVVFLDVTLAHAAPRVGFNQARPLLLGNPRAQWKALMASRRPIYERIATISVSTDGCTPTQVVQQITAALDAGSDPAPTDPEAPTNGTPDE